MSIRQKAEILFAIIGNSSWLHNRHAFNRLLHLLPTKRVSEYYWLLPLYLAPGDIYLWFGIWSFTVAWLPITQVCGLVTWLNVWCKWYSETRSHKIFKIIISHHLLEIINFVPDKTLCDTPCNWNFLSWNNYLFSFVWRKYLSSCCEKLL